MAPPPADTREWYFTDAFGRRYGPNTTRELAVVGALKDPELDDSCLVWNQTMANWTPIQQLGGLAAFFAALGPVDLSELGEQQAGAAADDDQNDAVDELDLPDGLSMQDVLDQNARIERQRQERHRVFAEHNARAEREIDAEQLATANRLAKAQADERKAETKARRREAEERVRREREAQRQAEAAEEDQRRQRVLQQREQFRQEQARGLQLRQQDEEKRKLAIRQRLLETQRRMGKDKAGGEHLQPTVARGVVGSPSKQRLDGNYQDMVAMYLAMNKKRKKTRPSTGEAEAEKARQRRERLERERREQGEADRAQQEALRERRAAIVRSLLFGQPGEAGHDSTLGQLAEIDDELARMAKRDAEWTRRRQQRLAQDLEGVQRQYWQRRRQTRSSWFARAVAEAEAQPDGDEAAYQARLEVALFILEHAQPSAFGLDGLAADSDDLAAAAAAAAADMAVVMGSAHNATLSSPTPPPRLSLQAPALPASPPPRIDAGQSFAASPLPSTPPTAHAFAASSPARSSVGRGAETDEDEDRMTSPSVVGTDLAYSSPDRLSLEQGLSINVDAGDDAGAFAVAPGDDDFADANDESSEAAVGSPRSPQHARTLSAVDFDKTPLPPTPTARSPAVTLAPPALPAAPTQHAAAAAAVPEPVAKRARQAALSPRSPQGCQGDLSAMSPNSIMKGMKHELKKWTARNMAQAASDAMIADDSLSAAATTTAALPLSPSNGNVANAAKRNKNNNVRSMQKLFQSKIDGCHHHDANNSSSEEDRENVIARPAFASNDEPAPAKAAVKKQAQDPRRQALPAVPVRR